MFERMVPDFVLICAKVHDVRSTRSVLLLSSIANATVRAGNVPRYSSPYPVHEYISEYAPTPMHVGFMMTPDGQARTVQARIESLR